MRAEAVGGDDPLKMAEALKARPAKHPVLGSWVNPCGTRLGIRKGRKGAVRLPKILVLIVQPNQHPFRALVYSARTLNAKHQSRVTLSLRQARFRAAYCPRQEEKGAETCPPNTMIAGRGALRR